MKTISLGMIILQTGTELVILSTVTTLLISAIVGVYLLRLWLKQSNRLLTDLPLVFAVTTLCSAVQVLILALMSMGVIETSLLNFKFRSLIISGSIIPVLGAVLQIWAPKIQKYHMRIIALVAIYWWAFAIFGSSESLIMTATIPLILISSIMLIVTFSITWRTGRLKEMRSGWMVIGVIPATVGQLLRVSLMNTPFFYIPDVLLTISFICIGIAFLKPKPKDETSVKEDESPKEIVAAVEY